MSFVRVVTLAAFAAGALNGVALAASAENGKKAYVQNGCWQCHGFEGQGSVASSGGRVIADTQLPLDGFIAYVRAPTASMPPFRPQMLSDADLTDIYAYLESRPKPKAPSDIPLLQQGR